MGTVEALYADGHDGLRTWTECAGKGVVFSGIRSGHRAGDAGDAALVTIDEIQMSAVERADCAARWPPQRSRRDPPIGRPAWTIRRRNAYGKMTLE